LDAKRAGSGWSAVELGGVSTVEVVVCPASVCVRPLLHEEAVRLSRLSRRAEHGSTPQRAAVLLASNVRMPVTRIAEMWHTDRSWVGRVVHDFDERGIVSLRPRDRGGRRDEELGAELAAVLEQIAQHHVQGTRFGISVDQQDGL
jgi:hypothetical protein